MNKYLTQRKIDGKYYGEYIYAKTVEDAKAACKKSEVEFVGRFSGESLGIDYHKLVIFFLGLIHFRDNMLLIPGGSVEQLQAHIHDQLGWLEEVDLD